MRLVTNPVWTEEESEALDREIRITRRMKGDRSMPLNPDERAEMCLRWYLSGRSIVEGQKVTGIKFDRYFKISDYEEGQAS